jgi:dolichyl-phosphate beta-glucosyltransferase
MYNEAARMSHSLPHLLAYLAEQPYTYEVIAVDDGSRDDTVAEATRLLANVPYHRVVPSRPNRGKGHALQVGMPLARGRYVLFTDADLSTPPDELEKFWPWLTTGWDVVIGSRKMAGSVLVRRQPWLRERLGKVFTWLSDLLATRDISDVTCGFKAFTQEAAHDLFRRSVVDDFSFDAEILFLAQRRGYRIMEVPVTWHDERGTKVNMARDAVRALRGLLRIRVNAVRGVYGPPVRHRQAVKARATSYRPTEEQT